MTELKPCPFCGSVEAELLETTAGFYVMCWGCDHRTAGSNWLEHAAADKWNMRHKDEEK